MVVRDKLPPLVEVETMLSKKLRIAMAVAGLGLVGRGHPSGWVVFATAIADDIVVSALEYVGS